VAKQGERPQFVQVTCEQCARIFRRTHGAVKRVKRIFCNRVCRRKFFVGANSPNYRGGHDPNRGCHWISLAAKIRKRDDYTCLRCGMTQVENGRKLDVDHIKPWRSFEDKNEANEPSNLASLCKRCHRIKSATIERDWLRGDRLGMLQYEKAVRLPPLFASVP
jgi:5-methylcytosine-specific restriction endonuclease McrA